MRRPRHLYEFGPFSIETTDRILLRDGETVPLKRKAIDTLFILIEHRGEVLEKDELMIFLSLEPMAAD
jgi:DNA-binding winged helix-turn-helix (wHTH) protein